MVNSKFLAFYYFFIAFLGGFFGFSLSVFMSVELNSPFTVFGVYYYYIFLTGHGIVMVFYFLTILSSGFFCYLVPFFCSYDESVLLWFLSFNVISIFFIFTSFVFSVLSFFTGFGINVGWTMYVPLSSKTFNSSFSFDFFVFSLVLFFLYLSFNSIGVIIFFFEYCYQFYLNFYSVPIFIWSNVLSSFLIYFSNPFFIILAMMLFCDSNMFTFYFECEYGGSLILYQNLFWFWGHPEVYVLILPVFGLISQIMNSMCGDLFNKVGMIFSMIFLFILSFLVWGHHMFVVGWSSDVKTYFMEATSFMSVPTGVKMFSWLKSLFFCCYSFNIVVGFLLVFILIFTFGGMTGIFLSNYSLDVIFHDSYFVVGHFHTVLASAAIFGYISSFFFYFKPDFFFLSSFSYKFSLYFFLFFFIFMFELLVYFHFLGFLNFPSSVHVYFINYYFIFHLGSCSLLGIWISLYFFCIVFMFF